MITRWRIQAFSTRCQLTSNCIPFPFLAFVLISLLVPTRTWSADDGDGDASKTPALQQQRMEMLRTWNQNQGQSRVEPSRRPVINLPPSIHHIHEPHPSIENKASTEVIHSKPVQPGHSSYTTTPSSRQPKPIRKSKTKLKRTKPNSRGSKSTKNAKINQLKKPHRCGFCTIDGFVYCGKQRIALTTLIEEDQKQRMLKRQIRSRHAHKRIKSNSSKTTHRVQARHRKVPATPK